MSKKENLVKWKTVETITPSYPDGVIFIKEDTSVEFPVAMVAFPLGGHENGTKKQRERAKLIAAAPDMLEILIWLNNKGGHGLKEHAEMIRVINKALGINE